MKKIILFLVLVVSLLLWALMQKEIQKEMPVEGEAQSVPVSETISAKDQEILQAALESPESFQTLEKVEEVIFDSTPLTVPKERPKLLSEVERPVRERVQKEPVAAENLYFWKDYESLQKDEIRNPDSKENREGVVALMKARQRRVGQEQ